MKDKTSNDSVLLKVTDAFKHDNQASISLNVKKLSAVSSFISTLNHKYSGPKEIQELSKVLDFLMTVLHKSVSGMDIPMSFGESIEGLLHYSLIIFYN